MLNFAHFLSVSWNPATQTTRMMKQVDATEFMSDWSQANWELLVELPFRALDGFGNAFLDVYGEGADCNGRSSRVWLPEALPTHRIVCLPLDGEHISDLLTGNLLSMQSGIVIFDHFAVKAEDGWHEQASPFDCVLGYHNEIEVLVLLEHVSFAVEKIEGSMGSE